MTATLDDPALYPLQPITPNLGWLEQQQREAPTDVRLAHDIGLAYYWLAKWSSDWEVSAQQWLNVIANWSIVLQNEFFWQGWANERSQIYQQSITIEQQNKARTDLEKRLIAELDEFSNPHQQIKPSLKFIYLLESKAVLSLRKIQGFQLAGPLGESLYCGPAMVQHLGLQTAVQSFFQEQKFPVREVQASLQFILASIQPGYAARQDIPHQLRLCYSSLGLAWICMEHGSPQLALELLTAQNCPSCHPELSSMNSLTSLERCRDDCARFAAENPAYASIQQGRDIFVADAAELIARAHLRCAEQCLGSSDISTLLLHLRQALKAVQKLSMQESLRVQIGQLLLAWAEEPLHAKRWDDVISLLANAGDFDVSGVWRGKLALAYDQRGVQHANAQEWEEGCADLRYAYSLTPHDTRIKENLLGALKSYESFARHNKDDSLYTQLGEEIKRVEAGELPGASVPVEPPPIKKDPTPPGVPVSSELPVSSLAHLELFDRFGSLNWEQFAPDGEGLLKTACVRAVDCKEVVVDLPALLLALYKESKTVREQLTAQGFSLENQQIFSLLSKQSPEQEEVNPRLQKLTPSQFDLWFTVLDILAKAWEKARQENKKITEAHLIYGMNASSYSCQWLERIGLKIESK